MTGNGVHTLETRIVDNAGRRSAWKAQHDPARLDAADEPRPRPHRDGWRNTSYSVVLNGSDAPPAWRP